MDLVYLVVDTLMTEANSRLRQKPYLAVLRLVGGASLKR